MGAQAEEDLGFVEREAQPVGVDFQQLAARAQTAHAEVGQAARTDHEPAAAWQALDDLAHQPEHRRLVHDLEIVKKQRKGLRVGRQRRHGVERRMVVRRFHAQAQRRFLQTAQETRDIVVGAIERQPSRGDALRFHAFARLGHDRGFAETRRRAHQHQIHRSGCDLFANCRTRHLSDDGCRRIELGVESFGVGRQHRERKVNEGVDAMHEAASRRLVRTIRLTVEVRDTVSPA